MAARDLISTEEDIHQVRHLYARALDLEKLGQVECLFISLEELESYIGDGIRRLTLQTVDPLDRIKEH